MYRPFIVALYYGKSKPKCLEKFLEPFIKEINILQEHFNWNFNWKKHI